MKTSSKYTLPRKAMISHPEWEFDDGSKMEVMVLEWTIYTHFDEQFGAFPSAMTICEALMEKGETGIGQVFFMEPQYLIFKHEDKQSLPDKEEGPTGYETDGEQGSGEVTG